MLRLSNLVTALFGVIAALGTILGIGSLGNASKVVTQPDAQPGNQLTQDPTIATTPDGAGTGLTVADSIAQSTARQLGQNATNAADSAASTTEAKNASQNPSAEFVVQGEGAVLTAEPAPPSTPSEAAAVQLDPSPGAVPATVPSQPPVAQVPEPEIAPAPAPVRAMW